MRPCVAGWFEQRLAHRSKGSVWRQAVIGSSRRSICLLCDREVLVGLACDVTLQRAQDLGFGTSLGDPACDVGAGSIVGTHASEHDPPERMSRLAVAATVGRCRSVRLPLVAGSGATPQRFAHAASERTLFALSPAATNKIAAVSTPTRRARADLARLFARVGRA